jgi:hypothetical protein
LILSLNANATGVTAMATVALVLVTWSYVRLTNRYISLTQQVLLLQQVPDVEIALDPFFGAKKLVVHNYGRQDVVQVKVWWAAYLHEKQGGPPVGTFFSSQPTAASPRAWWEIPQLGAGLTESKDFSELIGQLGRNIDATNNGLKSSERRIQLTRLVFTIQYRREVDRKAYSSYVSGVLLKDSKTGTYFLHTSPFAPEPSTPEFIAP